MIPISFGVLGFFVVVGSKILQPDNIAWLHQGDPAQAFIGWHFFRQSPWGLPLAASPANGMELSSSVFYTDSIPMLALLFKLFSPLLPNPFQYFGLWLLACFALQGFFGWKLLGLVTERPWLRILGTGFFIFAPPFLLRLWGHYSLCGQWLILAGLYLCLTPSGRGLRWGWLLLLLCASLIHAYLLAMVAALWVSNLARRLIFKEVAPGVLFSEILIALFLVTVALWQAGFFMIRSGLAPGGFGFYRMNVQSLLDSGGWSYLLKDLPRGKGDYEGFAFLGLGVLCLFVMVIPALPRIPWRTVLDRRWLPLSIVLLALTAFAITHHIGFGPYDYQLPLPDSLVQRLGALRGSGRMFWPVYYMLLLIGLWALINGFSLRLSTALMAGLLAVQVADTSAGWRSYRAKFERQGTAWETPLKSAFWEYAARHYQHIRIVPPGELQPVWDRFMDVAYFAAQNGLSIDSAYTSGRMDTKKVKQAQQRARAVVESGSFEKDSLYILDETNARHVAISHAPTDLLAHIDGFWVLAPGWTDCHSCSAVKIEPATVTDIISVAPLNESIFFGSGGNGKDYLGSGWWAVEEWGVWSEDPDAELVMRMDGNIQSGIRLDLEMQTFLAPTHPQQTVACWVEGKLLTTLVFDEHNNQGWRSVLIPKELLGASRDKVFKLELRVANPMSPKAAGVSNDSRTLGIGLVRMKVSEWNGTNP